MRPRRSFGGGLFYGKTDAGPLLAAVLPVMDDGPAAEGAGADAAVVDLPYDGSPRGGQVQRATLGRRRSAPGILVVGPRCHVWHQVMRAICCAVCNKIKRRLGGLGWA